MKRGDEILRTLQEQRTHEGDTPKKPSANEPFVATSENSGVTMRLEIDDFDRHGVVLREIAIRITTARKPTLDEWVARLKGISALPAEVQLIEHDSTSSQVVFRTRPDTMGRFVELRLDRGSVLTLVCFAVDKRTNKRQRTAVNMSRDSFVMLVDELCEPIESSS